MKKLLLPLFIMITAILYIAFIPEEPLAVKIAFKLLPMVLIILYAFRQLYKRPATSQRLIIIGLFFCMLGDAFIAVSFVAGLGAFLVGHLFYLTGFLKVARTTNLRMAAIIPITVYAFSLGSPLISSLRNDGNEALTIPVIAYMLIISIMALSAIFTGNKWVTVGSILFVISDSILSWNMFVSDISYSNAWIMTTYYAAQFLIASGIGSLTRDNNAVNTN